MSDDSISYGEDKENLLYISKKINVDEFGLGEEHFVESVSDVGSEISLKPADSEVQLLEVAQKTTDPLNDPNIARKLKSFHLEWAFGMNGSVGLINLSNSTRKELFFSSVHSAILYNYCSREMKHLEGHQATINCISSDKNGDWLVSADGDKDGCLIIWSSSELTPVFTLFNTYMESGILLTAMSPCARYLITIGVTSSEYYSIDFWLWTLGEETSNDTYLVHQMHGAPIKICFNPDIEEHIMVVFEKQVFLLTWDTPNKSFLPAVIPTMSNQVKIGQLTCGTYMNECHECYASSSKGCILVFRNTLYGRSYNDAELNNSKMYINAIKVSSASIGVITTTEGVLVVGDAKGNILFFDKMVRVLYWIRNMSLGAITSISFSISPKLYKYENSKIIIPERTLEDDHILDCDYEDREEEITKLIDAPFDATLDNKPFTVRDFFLSTADCNIYAMDFIRNACTPIFQVADANISCFDAHDESPYIVIGYENGRLVLINFDKKEQISTYLLPKTEETANGGDVITCIKYSPESLHLICGRENGEVWTLEPIVLKPKVQTPFKYSHSKIVKIAFAQNSSQFAYYDNDRTVMLFSYRPEENRWTFSGKIRPHYQPINDIGFFNSNPEGHSVLYTIGADRYMVEYNNMDLKPDNDIVFDISTRERIEQSAVPVNFIYYEKKVGQRDIGYILVADNKQKIKMLHAATKVPRSVVLGPSLGCFKNSHVRKMEILPQSKFRYLIFMCQKHLGIYILPPDGNPFKHTGYLAHPNQIADFTLSYDGLYAFTYGDNDRCILQWEIHTRSVDFLSIMGGTELEPYYCLLEGGKNGWLFQEIQDLFFYMQILQQENIDLPRRVSDSINLTEVPDLVRTCGYYPSNFELETMMIDIRYREFDESGEVRDEISFVDFVKLFINHRPVYGYSVEEITENFKTVCSMADYPRKNRIGSHDLVYLLQNIGEPSPNLHKYLITLLGTCTYGSNNFDFLPQDINLHFLLTELLGIKSDKDETQEEEEEVADTEIASYFRHMF